MATKQMGTINPRNFKEKIELLKRKEAASNAKFSAAIRDAREICEKQASIRSTGHPPPSWSGQPVSHRQRHPVIAVTCSAGTINTSMQHGHTPEHRQLSSLLSAPSISTDWQRTANTGMSGPSGVGPSGTVALVGTGMDCQPLMTTRSCNAVCQQYRDPTRGASVYPNYVSPSTQPALRSVATTPSVYAPSHHRLQPIVDWRGGSANPQQSCGVVRPTLHTSYSHFNIRSTPYELNPNSLPSSHPHTPSYTMNSAKYTQPYHPHMATGYGQSASNLYTHNFDQTSSGSNSSGGISTARYATTTTDSPVFTGHNSSRPMPPHHMIHAMDGMSYTAGVRSGIDWRRVSSDSSIRNSLNAQMSSMYGPPQAPIPINLPSHSTGVSHTSMSHVSLSVASAPPVNAITPAATLVASLAIVDSTTPTGSIVGADELNTSHLSTTNTAIIPTLSTETTVLEYPLTERSEPQQPIQLQTPPQCPPEDQLVTTLAEEGVGGDLGVVPIKRTYSAMCMPPPAPVQQSSAGFSDSMAQYRMRDTQDSINKDANIRSGHVSSTTAMRPQITDYSVPCKYPALTTSMATSRSREVPPSELSATNELNFSSQLSESSILEAGDLDHFLQVPSLLLEPEDSNNWVCRRDSCDMASEVLSALTTAHGTHANTDEFDAVSTRFDDPLARHPENTAVPQTKTFAVITNTTATTTVYTHLLPACGSYSTAEGRTLQHSHHPRPAVSVTGLQHVANKLGISMSNNDYQLLTDPQLVDYVTDENTEAQLLG